MNTLEFQKKAIDSLVNNFKLLYPKKSDTLDKTPKIILQAPTGSGKTFITESFINELNNQPDFTEDIAFIWITFSDDLAMQSRDKFRDYFSSNLNNQLLTVDDFSKGKLEKNDILFTNWQKFNIAKDKFDKRLLRRPDNDERKLKESGYYYDDILENTHAEGREIIVIIDESHAYDSKSAKEIVLEPIKPRVIIKMSATPFRDQKDENEFYNLKGRELAAIVPVERKDVIEAGLIKKEILAQTEEDIMTHRGEDIEKLLLKLAIEKRLQLKAEWERVGKQINPLVLIQLPDDTQKDKDKGLESKYEHSKKLLLELGIPEEKIASKLNDSYENMESITKNDSTVDFMFFKIAAATGWDCPRAHILVRFREIKSENFNTQTLGRILRMPFVDKNFSNELLQTGYLFTNFPRSEIGMPDDVHNENRPKVFTATLKSDIKKELEKNKVIYDIESIFEQAKEIVAEDKEKTTQLENVCHQTIDTFTEHLEKMNFVTRDIKNENQLFEKVEQEIETSIQTLTDQISDITKDLFSSEDDVSITDKIINLSEDLKEVALDKYPTQIILDPLLISDFISRADYGDIGSVVSFENSFINSMNKFFEIDKSKILESDYAKKQLAKKGVDTDFSLTQDIMVNVRFKSENPVENDNSGKNIKYEMSENDVEHEFAWKCYDILCEQTEEDAKIGNVARSWGSFKGALRNWFKNYVFSNVNHIEYYKVFIKDVLKVDSIFKRAITQSLKEYRPILNEFIAKRTTAEESEKSLPFAIKSEYSWTDEYEQYPAKRSIVNPFYLRKDYNGRDNETDFIKYLEESSGVNWWFKNGDNGKDFFAIKYYNSIKGKNSLFYPDWIIKLDDGRICILDTKKDLTTEQKETKDKAEALYNRIQYLNKNSKMKYVGGIVIKANGQWYIQQQSEYKYNPNDLNMSGWKSLAWNEL